jgi:RNA methyltransferase, TrmH family
MNDGLITSRNNPKVKQVRSLRQRKQREATGLFLAEGIQPVAGAVQAASAGKTGTSIEYIFFSPELLTSDFARQLVEEQLRQGTPCFSAPGEIFRSIAEKDNPQGILAVVRKAETRLADLSPANFPWGVALESPQDPGNIGTILRTIDGVGASGLILIDSSADPFHPNAVRASMGALFWLPWVRTSLEDFKAWAIAYKYNIYGTSAHGSIDFHSIHRYPSPFILLMGSEREGLSPEALEVCDQLVRLPMHGRISSLNLAVATGIMLYDIRSRMHVEK